MRAAVIDDTKEDARVIQEALERFGREEKIEIMVSMFDHADRFLEEYEKINPELVIMDIDMPGINGMEAAHKMRKLDENVALIFVTNMKHYALEGYSVDALDYLIKPVVYEDFALRMQKVRRYIVRNRDERIPLHTAGGVITPLISEIYYVESMLHTLIWHTKNGDFKIRDSMTRAEQKLRNFSFASCNKSFLVNLRDVESIDRDEVTVAGTPLKISRGKKASFISQYTRYLGGMRL